MISNDAVFREGQADHRDKARAYETILQKADGIEDEVQALLSSAQRLLRSWDLLEPAERRARLSDVVSAVVVDVSPGGGTNTRVREGTVHFRGLLEDVEATRVRIKSALAEDPEVPELQHLRPAVGAEVLSRPSQWLPGPDSNQQPSG